MASSPEAFEQELRTLLEDLRPYGLSYYHPLVNGEIETLEQLAAWCRQFYVRDVAVLLARTYAKCPHLDARRFIAENLYEEEGRFQEGRSHPELSRRLPRFFGMTDEEIEEAYRQRQQGPAARARQEMSQRETWLEEFAGFGLGAEYYAPTLFDLIDERLRTRFGLPEEVLEFFTVHLQEDEAHARRTMEIVTRYARTDEEQAAVVRAIREHVLGPGNPMGPPAGARRLSDEIAAELRRRPLAARS